MDNLIFSTVQIDSIIARHNDCRNIALQFELHFRQLHGIDIYAAMAVSGQNLNGRDKSLTLLK
jgi:hypothetical protein